MVKRKIPPTRFPDAVAVTYQRSLIKLVREMKKVVLHEYDEAIKHRIIAYRSDSDDLSVIQQFLELIKAMTLNIFEKSKLVETANRFVEGLNLFNMKNMNDQAKVAGVNLIDYEEWIDDYVESTVQQNVGYIQAIHDTLYEKIQSIIFEGMKNGSSTKEIREQLIRQAGLGEVRAQFIAVDQAGSIHGQLVARRHKKMGVKKFEWITSGDERVRESHKALSGKICDYKNPPNGKVPGQDYRCRCTAYPKFE